MSDMLTGQLQCEHILFLRKKRGTMVANYVHGIDSNRRGRLRFPFSRQLAEHLCRDYRPRPIDELKPFLPEPFCSTACGLGLDTYFPIYWHNNLYGLYLIRSGRRTGEATFDFMISSLAQTLSSAYHVKWYESKLKQSDAVGRRGAAVDSSALPDLAQLVRFRNTSTLVPQLVESLKEQLGCDQIALMHYREDQDTVSAVVCRGKRSLRITSPSAEDLGRFLRQLEDRSAAQLDRVGDEAGDVPDWVSDLRKHGLDTVASLPLSRRRRGLLAVAGVDSRVVEKRLGSLKPYIRELVQNAESHEEVEELSYTDNLTGLSNRRYLIKRLGEEIMRAQRYGRRLGLIIFDLDQLKSINDRHGHQAGDAVLAQLGRILRDSIRSIDIVARYGGDEFCVVMPEADRDVCIQFMARLQSSIAQEPVRTDNGPEKVNCTISLGAALYPQHGKEPEKLIWAADMALLKAKESGRNQAVVFEPGEPPTD
jgi:diguanylate cyclase (GGDEF)-like protein